MLLLPNRKKIVSTIVAGMRKKPDFVQGMGEPSGTGEFEAPEAESGDPGLESAMDDLIKAVHAKDAAGAAAAFRSAMTMCDSDEAPAYEGD